MTNEDDAAWPKQIFDLLVEGGVSLFTYVPDAGNKSIIDLAYAHNETQTVLLSTEEEGVAICAGADLVGKRAVLCMQSSGVGNCPNFLSLIKGGRYPLLMIVSMRGDYGEENPWQYPMGQATAPILEAMGMLIIRLDRQEDLTTATNAALAAAFKAGQGVALILSQQFLGAKNF